MKMYQHERWIWNGLVSQVVCVPPPLHPKFEFFETLCVAEQLYAQMLGWA